MDPAGSARDAEAIRLQLERILASKIFFPAQRSQAFLRYVVEKSIAGPVPKEYEIALEVFERRADYDPAIDATVRVEASRLRNRMREYYDTQGNHDPILIEIPKGGYSAVFTQVRREQEGLPEDSLVLRPGSGSSRRTSPTAGDNGGGAEHVSQPDPPDTAAFASKSVTRTRASSRALIWISLLAGLSVAVAFSILTYVRWERARMPFRSLAVLPLSNLSGDPSQEYFADGMTDELITELARIPNLRVVSRTSIVGYKWLAPPTPRYRPRAERRRHRRRLHRPLRQPHPHYRSVD